MHAVKIAVQLATVQITDLIYIYIYTQEKKWPKSVVWAKKYARGILEPTFPVQILRILVDAKNY